MQYIQLKLHQYRKNMLKKPRYKTRRLTSPKTTLLSMVLLGCLSISLLLSFVSFTSKDRVYISYCNADSDHELVLLNDGTFRYLFPRSCCIAYNKGDNHIKGHWYIERDLLELVSSSLSKQYQIDGDKISLINDEGIDFYNCSCSDEFEETLVFD